jgi:hypothetical protein
LPKAFTLPAESGTIYLQKETTKGTEMAVKEYIVVLKEIRTSHLLYKSVRATNATNAAHKALREQTPRGEFVFVSVEIAEED